MRSRRPTAGAGRARQGAPVPQLGTWLAEHAPALLDEAVSSIIGEPQLKAAILQDAGLLLGTGQQTELALATLLRTRIADFAADNAGGILSDARAWAQAIGERLAGVFPGLGAPNIATDLLSRIEQAVLGAQAQFEAVLQEVGRTEDVAQALKAVGIEVSSAAGARRAARRPARTGRTLGCLLARNARPHRRRQGP
ncbi:hypothetical protein HNO88_003684 [Novosphingobium chloroacetimidivorans]|uniref:Uncharacterized protein n=1 Tax=Novosphingobium chloroacetimidivorans TaxID=1428314 RepID=A0A7W7KDC6_9SPHN|nr:hypothetical protein [Novosphingobium chloroacetimidivorans]MBB4860341.1 hypothetical protein [Novosphingobium chloroacetimidivorans]